MSRAFVKEPDADSPEELPELPVSPHPNYVTATGLAQLRERLERAEQRLAAVSAGAVEEKHERAQAERDIRWLRARIATARPLVPEDATPGRVAFGATVELADEDGSSHSYRIVGEDEAAPAQGLVSWVSPLASALLGARVGDVVTWRRPNGDVEVEVRAIRYDAGSNG